MKKILTILAIAFAMNVNAQLNFQQQILDSDGVITFEKGERMNIYNPITGELYMCTSKSTSTEFNPTLVTDSGWFCTTQDITIQYTLSYKKGDTLTVIADYFGNAFTLISKQYVYPFNH